MQIDYLGIFDNYPKKSIINFLGSFKSSGWDKKQWSKVSDQIYFAYVQAVKDKNYPRWEPKNASNAGVTLDYVHEKTGVPRRQVDAYIMGLYTMVKMGLIDPKFWNPKENESLENTKYKTIKENIKRQLEPISVITEPINNQINKILFVGLLGLGGWYSINKMNKKRSD